MNRFRLVVAGTFILAFVVATIAVRNVARKASVATATSTATSDDSTKITTLQLDKATPMPRTPRTTTAPAKSARETSAALNMRQPEMTLSDELIRLTDADSFGGTVWGGRVGLPGATVSLLSATTLPGEEPVVLRTAKSDENGSYSLTKLNNRVIRNGGMSGGCRLVACKEGFEPTWLLSLQSSSTANDFHLSRSGRTFAGIVLDADTMQPLEGVTVYEEPLYPQVKSITDAQGKFTAHRASPLTQFHAFKAGYYQKTAGWYSLDATDFGNYTPQILMVKGSGATIKGSVVDCFGEPLRGITRIDVKASHPNRTQPYGVGSSVQDTYGEQSVRTDADGNFTLTNVQPGSNSVTANRNGDFAYATVEANGTETIEGVKLQMPTSISLTGVLLDAADAKPLAGVKLAFLQDSAQRTLTTDENGEFAARVTIGLSAPAGNAVCRVKLIEAGMLFVLPDGNERSIAQPILIVSGDKTKHVELRVEKDLPCITGRVIFDSSMDMARGVTGKVLVSFHDETGVQTTDCEVNPDGTYCVILTKSAKLTKAFLMFVNGNYAALVPLTGHKTEHDMITNSQGANSKGTVCTYTMTLTDGTPLLQTAGDTFGVDAVYVAEDGLAITPDDRDAMFASFNVRRMMLRLTNWRDVRLRIKLPDGVVIEKPVPAENLHGKALKFVYDPTAKDVTIEVGEQPPPEPGAPTIMFK